MAAQICLKTDVEQIHFALDRHHHPGAKRSRINGPQAVFASRMLIGLNLTSCQIEKSNGFLLLLTPLLIP